MRRLVAAELLKLRTTRTSWILTAAALGLIAAFHLLNFALKEIRPGDDVAGELQLTGIVVTLTMVLGIVGIAGEHRHGTIRVTLLVTPRRGRVLAAKAIADALVGGLLGALAAGLTALVVLPWLAATDTPAGLSDARIAAMLAGFVPLAAGAAVLGLALGAIVRNQAGAIAVALVWTALVDGLLATAVDAYAPYSLAGASDAVTSMPASAAGGGVLAPWAGGLLLAAYAAALLAAGATLMSRRDVE